MLRLRKNGRAKRNILFKYARWSELTRWGRSMLDLFHTLQDLQAWGISRVAQTGLQFDLRSAQGKLIASLMAALAEFERDLLRERVRSGIAAARKRGSGVLVQHVPGDRAYYQIDKDQVVLPEPSHFLRRNGYYQTALHECGHSTGHPDRMDRDTLKKGLAEGFGSPGYAREELRAEISAMMTGERVGVGHDPQRGAAYAENWVRVLEEDPREIHRAAAEAQRMSDYLISRARGKSRGSVGE